VKIQTFNITEILANAKTLIEQDKQISPAIKAMFELLIAVITLLTGKLSLTSHNSSKPPSNDPNRKKKTKGSHKNKPGGQLGRVGKNLEPVDNPDKIISLKIDKRSLPRGHYREVGFESRQVVDIEISRVVTEYQAQILEDEQGNRYVADFPEGVSRPIQYGQSIKSHAVYLSQFQLLPYERLSDYFMNEAQLPVSVGSLFNFNKEAYDRLEEFEKLAKEKLQASQLLHADETGINLNGKRIWLHNASNELWTYFYPHEKRGSEATEEIGILPKFQGILVHDHWKPYYTYTACRHALCNAHHIRELQWVIDNPSYKWAKDMQDLLLKIKEEVHKSAGILKKQFADVWRERYRQVIEEGLSEMPPPKKVNEEDQKKKRGRKKKTKELNLLERLRDYEDDVLRFMMVDYVPFTNNLGENDIRMTKVQQKISGCFRSIDGAKIFCRIRSYLLTSQKHGIPPTDAMRSLFNGKLPDVLHMTAIDSC
jgi:transposase